ncbi:hypothetical protein [Corynebacterium sp. TAE3-ERU16]|uniref:hypothetical protein n=1 Tax=Corynebacterium sp. TAE3-ERU16 TaxID=2849493 RepID=UPI001C495231|nr:hypothetical protein [Corynebacterium sp. TAE3-ERU16]MBV7293288.1 hypothetical protein [Corynebacterium sp. TAE3-ERU16]
MTKEQKMTITNNNVSALQDGFRRHAAVVPAASVWNGHCRPVSPGGGAGVRKMGAVCRTPGPISPGSGHARVEDSDWATGRHARRGAALRTYVAGALIGGALFAGFFIAAPADDAPVGQGENYTTSSVALSGSPGGVPR